MLSRAIKYSLLGLALIVLAACTRNPFDRRALIIIDNRSECGTIPVRLTNKTTNQETLVRVAIGESKEVEIQPDVFYRYFIDFSAAGTTADNFRCTEIQEGDVRVPAGSRQTFTLRSEKVLTPQAVVTVTPGGPTSPPTTLEPTVPTN